MNVRTALAPFRRWRRRRRFRGSAQYWEDRYASGGTSGAGSYGRLAEHKADVLNQLIESSGLKTFIEFGCGDGAQLSLVRYPTYTGLDISPAAIDLCKSRFRADASKTFAVIDPTSNIGQKADVSLSLDVLYHLVEDSVFDTYMGNLFLAAQEIVVIYSTNDERLNASTAPHVRHRNFTRWVEEMVPEWRLNSHIINPYSAESRADFYIFSRMRSA